MPSLHRQISNFLRITNIYSIYPTYISFGWKKRQKNLNYLQVFLQNINSSINMTGIEERGNSTQRRPSGGGDHSIKRGNFYYLASFPWEEICYIVIFPEGNGFLSFFFGIPRDDWGNGAVQHWYTVGMSRSTGVLEYSTTARPHRSSTKI